MGKFNLNRFEGGLGIWQLGSTVSCFIGVMVFSVSSQFEDVLPEVQGALAQISFYTAIAGGICLALGLLSLGINAYRARYLEEEGTSTIKILIIVGLTIAVIIASLIVPILV